jgi:hypothetical protein
MPADQLHFLPSLDFPGRTTLYLWEIAERVGCTEQHLLNEIDAGSLVVLDIKAANVARRAARVPAESYRNWVLSKLPPDADLKMRGLTQLPSSMRRELIEKLTASLRTNP